MNKTAGLCAGAANGNALPSSKIFSDSSIHALLLSKLSIERCQSQLAYVYALLYMAYPDSAERNLFAESLYRVIGTLEGELAYSARTLGCFG